MFVTSDVFNLDRYARWRRWEWRENLICGVEVGGSVRCGPEAEARFLVEAAELCGLTAEMKWAGYGRPGDARTYALKPASMARLAEGKLSGAATASSVFLRGERDALGSRRGAVMLGGDSSSMRLGTSPSEPRRPFDVDFCFPLNGAPQATASALLRLGVDLLDAEYGYYFVRDDLCEPNGFAKGWVNMLDHTDYVLRYSKEVDSWRRHVKSQQIWTDPCLRLRDLFEVNLLSARHTSARIDGLGYLLDWISASPARGELEPLSAGRVLWTLTDQQMVEVRPILDRVGLLRSCLDRVYRDLEDPVAARLALGEHGQFEPTPPRSPARW
jgi:hypothetical protein